MARLTDIWVLLTTATQRNANTDAIFDLTLSSNGSSETFQLEGLPHDERERGRTDEYHFEVNEAFEVTAIQPGNFILTITGSKARDGWLPKRIWVIGRDSNGEFHALVHRPDWPEDQWFDADGERTHNLG